ncbi:LysR family transcriptional regulator [Caryophanon tenue]|uniref:LysR family transcriptional regulator n=1 Tax=Caryophanon tenue TaxID=33978 RepID=A0A1C0YER8_9BACL|nr:LysR family transcriptional regulator [Caryophanon tenue]OCS85650.1 LysR family transcriptional regulator [Caryophanon tenue]
MVEKDWEALIAIREEGNISRAARRLFVSQPALTYRIQNLEEQFNIKILYKIKGGVDFTIEGQFLVKYAERMLKELQETKDRISNLSEEVRGLLRIGSSDNFAQYILPGILKEFSTSYPNVLFNINTGWSTYVMELLNTSKVHVGILRGNNDWYGEKILMNVEKLYLISKEPIDMNDVPNMPYISYKTDASLRNLIDKWWYDRYQIPPNVIMETNRQETCKEMVKHGLGITILPKISLINVEGLHRYELILKSGVPVERETWLLYSEQSKELEIVKKFIDFIQKNKNLIV